jgi:hypothetical protein
MTISRSVFRLNSLSLLLVVIIIGLTKWSNLAVSELFSNAFFSPQPNLGLLTRTFQLLCSVPFLVCAFSYVLLKTLKLPYVEERFLLCSAIFTGAFLFNEIYRVHVYMVVAGFPKIGVVVLYSILLVSYGWFFRREFKATPYQLALTGLGLLFVAMTVDLLHLPAQVNPSALEGVPKLFSEINIAFYYWYVCTCLIEKVFRQNSNISL